VMSSTRPLLPAATRFRRLPAGASRDNKAESRAHGNNAGPWRRLPAIRLNHGLTAPSSTDVSGQPPPFSRPQGTPARGYPGTKSPPPCYSKARSARTPHAVASRALIRQYRPKRSAPIEGTGKGRRPANMRVEVAEKSQVSTSSCKRICKRDLARRPETRWTHQVNGDHPQPVDRGQHHPRRRPETAETYVVLLITQRRTVQSVR